MARVIILGAKGRFGRAATRAFVDAGWDTCRFARNWDRASPDRIEGDVTDTAQLIRACDGCDVIVNAVNPPYPAWARVLPTITASVIAAAQRVGATVMIPGNIYNYGSGMPPVLRESTPWRPDTRKGHLRVEMETSFRAAGVRTIVLRAGDFIDTKRADGWFDTYIAPKAHAGRTMYPGPRDLPHAWAYLPDMARAAVGLATIRNDFDRFEEFAFAGYGLTGRELIAQITAATGTAQRVSGLPWPLVRLIGVVKPLMREVHEMSYLWHVPHVVDGSKLAAALPDLRATPVDEAIARVLGPAPGDTTAHHGAAV